MFIARAIEPVVASHGIRISEEGIFSTLKKAKHFIERLVSNLDEREMGCMQFVILQYEVNSQVPWTTLREWRFDSTGCLLLSPDGEEDAFTAPDGPRSFESGDIVRVAAYPWASTSSVQKPVLGVVHFHDPSSRECIVSYIDESGRLEHCHVGVAVLTPFDETLPAHLRFLKILSRHHRKECLLPEEVLQKIYWREMLVVDVLMFSFERFEHQ